MAGQDARKISRAEGKDEVAQDLPLASAVLQTDIALVAQPGRINRFLEHDAHVYGRKRTIIGNDLVAGILLRKKVRRLQPRLNGLLRCDLELRGIVRGPKRTGDGVTASTQSDRCQDQKGRNITSHLWRLLLAWGQTNTPILVSDFTIHPNPAHVKCFCTRNRAKSLLPFRLEIAQQPVQCHLVRGVVFPVREVGDEVFPDLPPHILAGIGIEGGPGP